MNLNKVLVSLLLLSSNTYLGAFDPHRWIGNVSNNLNDDANWDASVPSSTETGNFYSNLGLVNLTPATLSGQSFTVRAINFPVSASAFSFTIPNGSLILAIGLIGTTTDTSITITNTNNPTAFTNPQLWYKQAVTQAQAATFNINNSGTAADASSNVINYSQFAANSTYIAGDGAAFVVGNEGTYTGDTNCHLVANVGTTIGGFSGGQVEFDDAFNATNALQMTITNQGSNNGNGNNFVGNIVNAQLYTTNPSATFDAGSNATINMTNTGINTGTCGPVMCVTTSPSAFIGTVGAQAQFKGSFSAADGLSMTIANEGTNNGASTDNFVGYVADSQLYADNPAAIFDVGSNATIEVTNTGTGTGGLVGYVGGQVNFAGDFIAAENLDFTVTNNGSGQVANPQILFNGGFSVGSCATVSAINTTSTLTNGITFSATSTATGGDVLINLSNSSLNVQTTGVAPFTLAGLNGNAAATVNSSQNLIIGLAGSCVVSAVFDGSITDNGLAGLTLTKEGTGAQVLNGLNTYTGETLVTTGTLEIGSSGSVAGDVFVSSNGTLFGLGFVGGSLTNDGVVNLGTLGL